MRMANNQWYSAEHNCWLHGIRSQRFLFRYIREKMIPTRPSISSVDHKLSIGQFLTFLRYVRRVSVEKTNMFSNMAASITICAILTFGVVYYHDRIRIKHR